MGSKGSVVPYLLQQKPPGAGTWEIRLEHHCCIP